MGNDSQIIVTVPDGEKLERTSKQLSKIADELTSIAYDLRIKIAVQSKQPPAGTEG